MPIVVVSLHERDAPLELLDRLAIPMTRRRRRWHALVIARTFPNSSLLSTCMRTEVYTVAERFHDGLADIHQFFEERLSDSPVGSPGAR